MICSGHFFNEGDVRRRTAREGWGERRGRESREGQRERVRERERERERSHREGKEKIQRERDRTDRETLALFDSAIKVCCD